MPRQKDLDPDLTRAMAESLKAYAAGDKRFFTFLTDDVRVFNVNSVEPMVSRKEFQAAFAPTLTGLKRKVDVLHEDIQASGDRAVLAQTLEITNEGVAVFLRQTVVWEQRRGKWQMSHIHNTLVGQPVASKLPTSAKAVRVLNERIATAAATLGVAQ